MDLVSLLIAPNVCRSNFETSFDMFEVMRAQMLSLAVGVLRSSWR